MFQNAKCRIFKTFQYFKYDYLKVTISIYKITSLFFDTLT